MQQKPFAQLCSSMDDGFGSGKKKTKTESNDSLLILVFYFSFSLSFTLALSLTRSLVRSQFITQIFHSRFNAMNGYESFYNPTFTHYFLFNPSAFGHGCRENAEEINHFSHAEHEHEHEYIHIHNVRLCRIFQLGKYSLQSADRIE